MGNLSPDGVTNFYSISQATESLIQCLPPNFPVLLHSEKLVFALSTSVLFYLYRTSDNTEKDDFVFGIFR